MKISRRRFAMGFAASQIGAFDGDDVHRYRTPYKYGRLVLAADKTPGAFDSRFVDCPFVFHHEGQYGMTYVGWDGTGYQTGLAFSTDLVNWRRQGCILKRDPDSPVIRHNVAMNWILRDTQLFSRGDLKKVDGRFLGAYHAYPNAGLEDGPAVIGLCWSDDLMHWQVEPPVLYPQDGAAWERGGLYKPSLIEHDGTYYLFYNAKTKTAPNSKGGWHEQTGVATSPDLKQWTRYQGSPVVRNGDGGSPDERFASDPCVLLDGDRWLLFYFGLDAKGVARELMAQGANPYHLAKTGGILIDVGAPGTVDSTYAHKPSLIYKDDVLYHFYCAVSGRYPNEVRGISVARSRPWS